jgi:hypothetical protein
MSAKCNAELCINWTGQGCICAVMGLDIEAAKTEEEESVPRVILCSHCTERAVLTVQAEEAQDEEMHGCAAHFADVALTVVDMYIDDGVVCVYRANEV